VEKAHSGEVMMMMMMIQKFMVFARSYS